MSSIQTEVDLVGNNKDNNDKNLLLKSASENNYKTLQFKFNIVQNNNNSNYKSKFLHDISCTLSINLREILNMRNINTLSKPQMEIIRNKILNISNLFKNYRKAQKTKKNLKSKLLVDHQLLEEIKRRRYEGIAMLRGKKNELMYAVEKKEKARRKNRAKFSEVEIFVRRECQASEKYRNLFINLNLDNFISKNTGLLKVIKVKKQTNKKFEDLIQLVTAENKDYKIEFLKILNEYSNTIIKKGKEKTSNIIKDLDTYFIILEDKNNFLKNYAEKLSKIYQNFYHDKLHVEFGLERPKYPFTFTLLNKLNNLPLNDIDLSFLNSESGSTNNNQIREDSSEIWSESDIEK